jgi:hypothetical protein
MLPNGADAVIELVQPRGMAGARNDLAFRHSHG